MVFISDITEIHEGGCADVFTNFIEDNISIIAGVAIGVAVIQLLVIILACCYRPDDSGSNSGVTIYNNYLNK